MENHIIGIDIGGTNTRVALLNKELEIIKKETVFTNDFNDVSEFLGKLKEMVEIVDPEKNADTMGVVFPAPWTEEQEVILDITNVPYLEYFCISKIKTFFSEYKLYFENDVNVIALLEADYGASRNSKHSIYITISTGIGSGMIINNQIYHGANGYAGEIGSIIISDKYAGREEPLKGSLEEICSGKTMDIKSIELYGEDATSRQIFLNYEKGEVQAEQILEKWITNLTQGLAAVVQVMDPHVIVLGGPVVLNHKWIIEKIEMGISQKVLGELSQKTKVVAAEYGTEAGVIGAAYYAQKKKKEEKKA